MVNPSSETTFNGKRSSSEIDTEASEVTETEMKKQKIENSSESDAATSTDKKSASELLKTRIKKYLEENRSLKYIDIHRMSENLHNNYPDYRRRKFKVFKDQVEFAFKSLTEDMGSRKKSNKKKKVASEATSKETIVEEIQIDDETTVKGSTMNSRLSNLYSNETKDKEENDICEVIEDDEAHSQNQASLPPQQTTDKGRRSCFYCNF